MAEKRRQIAQALNAERDAKLAEEQRKIEQQQEAQAEQVREAKGYGAW